MTEKKFLRLKRLDERRKLKREKKTKKTKLKIVVRIKKRARERILNWAVAELYNIPRLIELSASNYSMIGISTTACISADELREYLNEEFPFFNIKVIEANVNGTKCAEVTLIKTEPIIETKID